MAWTTPTHVSSGEADSGKFNEETVDNIQFLYNSLPQVLSAQLSGGPTSGTTELLLTGSVSIPAQPVNMQVVPAVNVRLDGDTANDYFQIAIRSTNAVGTIRGASRVSIGSNAATTVSGSVPLCQPYALAAGVPETVVATLLRTAGSGVATLDTGAPVLCVLTVLLLPDL